MVNGYERPIYNKLKAIYKQDTHENVNRNCLDKSDITFKVFIWIITIKENQVRVLT